MRIDAEQPVRERGTEPLLPHFAKACIKMAGLCKVGWFMISIIIPFYQRQSGLLQRAIRSVLNQTGDAPWRLIVVDDGSPRSAEEELAPLRAQLGDRLTLIKQSNGGISAARNRALDALSPTSEIVAFLDSDDEWEPGHLDRIVAAWRAGADFFFEDCQRHGAPHSWFREVGFKVADHAGFDAARDLYWFQGDFFDALLRRSPALVSTIAYKFSALPRLRFTLGLSPGEDIYFWMQTTPVLKQVAFSPVIGAPLGAGVNVSIADWGTVGEVKRLFGERRYRHLIGQLPLTQDQRELNRLAIKGLNVDFWRAVLATARRGDYRSGRFVKSYLGLQPSAIAQFPAALLETVRAKTVQTA
jgi:succinoglycan biosynthesis protein ExoW